MNEVSIIINEVRRKQNESNTRINHRQSFNYNILCSVSNDANKHYNGEERLQQPIWSMKTLNSVA